APQNFTATGGCAGVQLNWSPPASNGGNPVTSYRIYKGGWNSETYFATTSGTSYLDNTGPQWAFNYYKVSAVTASGEGAQTQNAGASMSCPPPPPTTSTSTSTTSTTRPPTTTTTTRPATTTTTTRPT